MKKSQELHHLAKSATRLTAMAFACQLLCMSVAHAAADAETAKPATVEKSDADQAGTTQSNDANRVTITGKKAGTGMMVQEDIPKARSTVTREELIKQRPTGNAYQALDMLPSVNTYNYDASGLFGGGMSVRGFNSDQLGFTINGVPVNDSGSFAVYPQEYVDLENTCSIYVTQGSTDVDSPHVGASGGNVGIVTCEPEKEKRIRLMQTVGSDHLTKTFGRYDTGLFGDGRTRLFISASHAQTDKWKGEGQAKRDHIDIGARWDYDRFNYVNYTFLFNRAINNNISSNSLAQIAQYGYNLDYATTYTGYVPSGPGAQTAKAQTPNAYYGLSVNPFENIVTSATIALRLGENTDVKIVPYFWYGYGTGGTQQKVLAESGLTLPFVSTGKTPGFTGNVDLNGDGDYLDKVTVANSSVTRTDRPGVTATISRDIGDHQLSGGVWLERAIHKQTGPAVPVDSNGNPADIWLQNDLILRPNGTPYESRDWRTVSTAYQFFVADQFHLMDDKLTLQGGIRTPHIDRNFTNYANEGGTNQLFWTTYNIDKSYSDVLPQLGLKYQINSSDQFFTSIAKNMKAPPNFAFSPAQSGANVGFIGGTTVNNINTGGQVGIIANVQPETSVNFDLGFRHQTDLITAQASIYYVNFKNRMATAFYAPTQTSTYTNAGGVTNKGFELELGTTPVHGWSYYGSVSNNNSRLSDNLTSTGKLGNNSYQVVLPTAGNEFPDTPKWKVALSAQYQTDAWFVRLKGIHTSAQQSTIMNDELTPDYNVFNLDAGYQLAGSTWLKKPIVRLNVSNLFNRQYLNSSSQSVINAKPYTDPVTKAVVPSSATVYYYEAQPRAVSVTFSADF